MLYPAFNSSPKVAYCGPTVLSSITGMDVRLINHLIQNDRGHRRHVVATHHYELSNVLKRVGKHLRYSRVSGYGLTFEEWLDRPRRPETTYVLDVDAHWLAVKGNYYCDTFLSGVPFHVGNALHLEKPVKWIYTVCRSPRRA